MIHVLICRYSRYAYVLASNGAAFPGTRRSISCRRYGFLRLVAGGLRCNFLFCPVAFRIGNIRISGSIFLVICLFVGILQVDS